MIGLIVQTKMQHDTLIMAYKNVYVFLEYIFNLFVIY